MPVVPVTPVRAAARLLALAVLVAPIAATVTVAVPAPAVAQMRGARSVEQIRADMQERLRALELSAVRLDELTRARPGHETAGRLREVAQEIGKIQRALQALHHELGQRLALESRPPPAPPQPLPPPPPAPPPPPVPPKLAPLEPPAFGQLLQTLRAESFENSRLRLLDDALRAGARLSGAQALEIMQTFTFGRNRVEAAAKLCAGGIVEPGALPGLLAALEYESDRQALRKRTGGRCGL